MNFFEKNNRRENKIRHEAFRSYYWQKQTEKIYIISIIFLVFCAISFFVVVPFEHAKYPDLGRLKYGIAVIAHILAALFSKWLLRTKHISDEKKAIVSEIFSFVLGLSYLLWGVIGMHIAVKEYSNPIILMYLILLATITAFLYYTLSYFILLVIISYTVAAAYFLSHQDVFTLDTTSAICAVIMMIVLGILSNTRYTYGRDKFEYEVQNERLIEEKSAQNEELEAQNEELTSVNKELNETTEKLAKALDDLEKSTAAQKLFTNSMNHELRAPLNGIIGTIQVMLMKDDLSDSDRKYLDQCMIMSKSLLNIVNDLLDFAKMDAGEFEIIPARFDFHDIMSNIEGTFKNQPENKGLKLIFNIRQDMPCGLYGDDVRIQQVISNIVSNGIKYTDTGSVTIAASFENDLLQFVISDTGQGMSEESLKDLFIPFKRIAESKNRKIQGTGLGMTIVMNLINKMDGSIDVNSTPGTGTQFIIKIPSEVVDENNIWSNQTANSKSNTDADVSCLKGKSLLYVDDTKVNLLIIEKLLSDTGMNITTIESATAGLNLAIDYHYDIIMVDHMMPDMSGPELLEAIKLKSDINNNTPVIIFTGNVYDGIEEEYTKMGFAGYMCKPVVKDALLELLIKISR